jgi:serine O-acetyltransferase
MEENIKSDLYRYYPVHYNLKVLLKGFREPGFCYTFFLRKSNRHPKLSFKGIIYRLLLRRFSYKFGFQIPAITKIGGGFYIGHFGTVVISPQAIIGSNCNIAHGVTVGRIGLGSKKGAPVIGDFVWMGTNSIIVGGITIGSYVLIAPGAFVNFDVPDNSLVVGNPGKIIFKENPVKNYIRNIKGSISE